MPVDPVSLASLAAAAVQSILQIAQPENEQMFTQIANRRQVEADLHTEISRLARWSDRVLRRVHNEKTGSKMDEHVLEDLKELKEIAYDASDLIDEYRTGVSRMASARKSWMDEVCPLFRCISSNCVWSSCKINPTYLASEICKIKKRMNKLDEMIPSPDIQITREYAPKDVVSKPPMSLRADKSYICVGRNDEIRCITQQLLPDYGINSNAATPAIAEECVIIPIVLIHGLAGMGKTFLANHVFHLSEVRQYFGENRVLIYVSDEDNTTDFPVRMLEMINCKLQKSSSLNGTITDMEYLYNQTKELVKGRKLFLVMDDVWITDIQAWEAMFAPLRKSCGTGTSIMITTRSPKVVEAIDKFCCREENKNFIKTDVRLQGLNEDDILNVLMNSACLRDKSDKTYMGLIPIAKKIAKKCNGWPIIANSIGSRLENCWQREEWNRESQFSFKIDEGAISRVVEQSYRHLSFESKPCLSIFSLFPSTFHPQEEEVVNLWMAHDFIHSKTVDGRLYSIETVGKICLTELEHSSILQHDSSNNSYSLHDFNHKLVLSIFDGDFLRLNVPDDYQKFSKQRHVSFSGEMASYKHKKLYIQITKSKKLRTLMFLREINSGTDISDFRGTLKHMLKNLKRLRALVLKCCPLKSLPKSISNLIHLRYLYLWSSSIEELPDSLGDLHNLLVLNLFRCSELKQLPSSVTNLVNMRHLLVNWEKITSPVKGIGTLTALQNLDKFDISDLDGHKISEIKNLNMIRGRFQIRNVDIIRDAQEAEDAVLHEKIHLQHINFKWNNNRQNIQANREEDVLESLRPQDSLISLSFESYWGRRPPTWLGAPLEILETIELVNCISWKDFIPIMAKMQLLKCLRIKDTVGQVIGGKGFYGLTTDKPIFPALEELLFQNIPDLQEWKGVDDADLSFLSKLSKLTIINCPQLRHVLPLPLTIKDIYLCKVGLKPFTEINLLSLVCNHCI